MSIITISCSNPLCRVRGCTLATSDDQEWSQCWCCGENTMIVEVDQTVSRWRTNHDRKPWFLEMLTAALGM